MAIGFAVTAFASLSAVIGELQISEDEQQAIGLYPTSAESARHKKRLSAKEIVGNKKKLTWWQDEFWKHMVKKYPDLERG